MKAKILRRVSAKLLPALLAASLLLPPPAKAAETLDIALDQATLMKLPEKVSPPI